MDDGERFPLTGQQFDQLIHYVETCVAMAFEAPNSPARASTAQNHKDALKQSLKRALVGPENA